MEMLNKLISLEPKIDLSLNLKDTIDFIKTKDNIKYLLEECTIELDYDYHINIYDINDRSLHSINKVNVNNSTKFICFFKIV